MVLAARRGKKYSCELVVVCSALRYIMTGLSGGYSSAVIIVESKKNKKIKNKNL